jgi:hypothetical protein
MSYLNPKTPHKMVLLPHYFVWSSMLPIGIFDFYCKIRSMAHSDSGVWRTAIPEHAAQ